MSFKDVKEVKNIGVLINQNTRDIATKEIEEMVFCLYSNG